jgi:hypothetical protein
MAETKTKPTEVDAEAFLAAVPDPQRRADGQAVSAMMERITGYKPVLWGPSIVGFGSYHYRYDSGHEGDAPRLGFSPRAKELVLYVLADFPECEPLLARLGKHKVGKSCLYIKKLTDVDMAVLEQLVAASLAHMDRKFARAD